MPSISRKKEDGLNVFLRLEFTKRDTQEEANALASNSNRDKNDFILTDKEHDEILTLLLRRFNYSSINNGSLKDIITKVILSRK